MVQSHAQSPPFANIDDRRDIRSGSCGFSPFPVFGPFNASNNSKSQPALAPLHGQQRSREENYENADAIIEKIRREEEEKRLSQIDRMPQNERMPQIDRMQQIGTVTMPANTTTTTTLTSSMMQSSDEWHSAYEYLPPASKPQHFGQQQQHPQQHQQVLSTFCHYF
jgi:uncharacterized protein HemY